MVLLTPDDGTGEYKGKYDEIKGRYNNPADSYMIKTDWFLAAGNLNGWITATVSQQGNQYTAYVDYNLQDYYRWSGNSAWGGLVLDAEMQMLHEYGWAKEYAQEGTARYKITWVKGQRIGEGAVVLEMD